MTGTENIRRERKQLLWGYYFVIVKWGGGGERASVAFRNLFCSRGNLVGLGSKGHWGMGKYASSYYYY